MSCSGTVLSGNAGWGGRVVGMSLGLLAAALICFVTLSLGTAFIIPLGKFVSGQGAGWGAGAVYLLVVFSAAWLIQRTNRWSEKQIVAGLIVAGVVLKVATLLVFPVLPFNIDQTLFHHFDERLAEGGFRPEVLSPLSEFYDYPLWASRVFPVHYWIQRLFGNHSMAWLKGLNVVAATLILLLTHALARRVLPPGKRKWAVFLLVALPFQTFWVTDYSHHLYSSLYLLTFTWTTWELAFGEGKVGRRLCFSGMATACLLLMAWQGGVDWIAMGMAGVVVALMLLGKPAVKHICFLAFFLLVVPVGGRALLKGPLLSNQIQACDVVHQNSVLPAFMARGWWPGTWGEYHRRYEELDRVTPQPKRAAAMFRLVASQMRHEPFKTCFVLPCVKTAKLFLVGYASNFEESLALAESRALPYANWVRRTGTFLFLLFVAMGTMRLAGNRISLGWTPVLLVPVLTWGAYVIGGETSPRYSVFCQPCLAIVGALAFSGESFSKKSRRFALARATVVLVLLLASAGALVCAIRLLPERSLYADLRRDGMGKSTPSLFESVVVLPSGNTNVSLTWTVPEGAAGCSFYPLQCEGAMDGAMLDVVAPNGTALASIPIGEHELPEYVELTVPPGAEELRVSVSRNPAAISQEGRLVFGYLLWSVP